MMKNFLFISLALLAIAACSKDDDGDARHNEELMIIDQYITDNGLDAESTESGLHYVITKEGNGEHPFIESLVDVRYKGYFLDGTVFDEVGGSDSIEFYLWQVIKGWQEGIPKLSKGGEGTLIIPSRLGYGSNPPAGIPADAILIFDVELIDFE